MQPLFNRCGLRSSLRSRIIDDTWHTARLRPRPFSSSAPRQAVGLGGRYIAAGLVRWARSPNFFPQVAGLAAVGGGVYIYNIETVPVSGRRRFNIVPSWYIDYISDQEYQSTLEEVRSALIPEYDPRVQMVEGVMARLIPHSGLPPGRAWRVHVIDADDVQNAFVLPGREVFVYSGLLRVCQGDDGLAAVLGHEIAHRLAGHTEETISKRGLLLLVGDVISSWLGYADFGLVRDALDVGFLRRGSRTQESEADYIGLMMMAEACYNPLEAVSFWERMGRIADDQKQRTPEFLSTHPREDHRVQNMKSWLEKAELTREQNGCSPIMEYRNDFAQAFQRWK